MSHSLPIPLGMPVTVRDDTPRPPERFTRKLAEWRERNYEGYVVGTCPYNGGYTIEVAPVRSYIRIVRSGVSPTKVQPDPSGVRVQVEMRDGASEGLVRIDRATGHMLAWVEPAAA